jgi:perosamine synthetase
MIEDDVTEVQGVIESGSLAQGERTLAFEQAIGRWVGVRHPGVGVASGSAATLLALMALGVGRGDEVILPTYVCHTVLQAVVTASAVPVLCDVGQDWVVSPDEVAGHLTKLTKAVIVPHMYGIFADVKPIRDLGVPVIEDCAQAVGSEGEWTVQGDIAVFSFHPTKCLTTGEGGMALSRDAALNDHMRALRDGCSGDIGWRLFSPLSDIASALGLSQLNRYATALRIRAELADGYLNSLEPIIPDYVPRVPKGRTMWFRFPLRAPGGIDLWQDPFYRSGIHVRRGVDRLLHRLLNLTDERFPKSVQHFEETVCLPIYPALSGEEHHRVVTSAQEIFSGPVRRPKSG